MDLSSIRAEMVVNVIEMERRTIVAASGSTLGATANVIMIKCEVTFNDNCFQAPYMTRILQY